MRLHLRGVLCVGKLLLVNKGVGGFPDPKKKDKNIDEASDMN